MADNLTTTGICGVCRYPVDTLGRCRCDDNRTAAELRAEQAETALAVALEQLEAEANQRESDQAALAEAQRKIEERDALLRWWLQYTTSRHWSVAADTRALLNPQPEKGGDDDEAL